MLQAIQRIISKIEDYPLTISQFFLAFSAIIALRVLGEHLLLGFADKSPVLFIGSALAAYLFFLFSYLLILLFLTLFLKESPQKMANVLLWGFWITVAPPLIDKVFCAGNFCWSFYAFDSLKGLGVRFLTFFGNNATVGITYGVRVEVALAVLFLIVFIFLKTRKALKSLLGGLVAYAILFILGSFPSWLTFVFLWPEKKLANIEGFDIAGVFLSPTRYFSAESTDALNALNEKMNLIYAFLIFWVLIFFLWRYFRKKFWAVARNVRWTQISVHAGLIVFGAALGAFYFPQNITLKLGAPWADNFFSFLAVSNLILAAVFAWLASVFLNDWVDLPIDEMTNKKRPLATREVSVKEYKQLFAVFFPFSLVLALAVGVKFFLIILVYQLIGWVYSAWPFRLKRFPIAASFISALALNLLFISGFLLLANNQDMAQFPFKIFWLLMIAFTVSLPIKDLKDIEGDKRDGVFTIPVLLGEKWSRFLIGLGIFVSYALSVVFFNAKILFFPAMILGVASLAVLQSKKISARRVHIWVFGLLFVYVFLMAYLVFWPVINIANKF